MSDKKKKLNDVELNEITQMPTTFKDKIFPTRIKGMNTILSVIINGKNICYVCLDTPTPDVAIIHPYLPRIYRHKDIINRLVDVFYSCIHPWCKDKGIKHITANCAADDLKTTELLKTFGFKVETINIAVMPVQGE